MSRKTLQILLGVVGALLVVYGVTVAVGPRTGSPARADALASAIESIDPKRVTAIRFYGPGDTVELRRGDRGWLANGYPADSGLVAMLWEALEEARVGQLVARNPANHGRLGVAEDSARVAEFDRGSGEPVRLLVGREGPSYPSVYVRLPGRDEVYLLHADLAPAARRSLTQWRDRTIVRVDTARVNRIEVEREGGRYVLARENGRWTLDGSAADSLAVSNLLRELALLVASDFAPDTARLPERKVRTVTALGAAGDTLARLTFGEGDARGWWVRVAGTETLYQIPAWQADRLAPERAEFVGR
ncbi:MAG TPA: DUF4340 domain-containing protein [Longimicrobiales bacterium]|jgi:hypothetical protein